MPLKGYKQSSIHKSKHISKIRGKANGNWKGGIKLSKEYFRKKYKQWRQKNKHKDAIKSANYRARRKGAAGSFTLGEWEILKIQYDFSCAYCRRREPSVKLEKDHIIPLSKGGSNYIENIQPLCRTCNASKYCKIIV
jgi:5-methylcytosine-specific restriction endonuclease McrA